MSQGMLKSSNGCYRFLKVSGGFFRGKGGTKENVEGTRMLHCHKKVLRVIKSPEGCNDNKESWRV